MMKGFVTKGLMLLALGLLLAGCAGPSEENAISSSHNGSIDGVPMVMDRPNMKLTVGDGSGAYQFAIDGHSVEIRNGDSTGPLCANVGGNAQCWIRLTNQDPDYYMANAFVMFTQCATCTTAGNLMDNFDAENLLTPACWNPTTDSPVVGSGCTVHLATTAAGANTGGSTPVIVDPLNGGGAIAYAADFSLPEVGALPNNPFGAPMQIVIGTTNNKPKWMIAGKCGMASAMWDFGGTDTTLFPFYATVKASWFPMDPHNGDARYDFQWYNTIYLTVTDLANSATDTDWQKVYRPGSIYRSNVLAGYKPAWAKGVSGVNVADINYSVGNQRYFAVNVGLEAPDRLETQSLGIKGPNVNNFEYYQQAAITISWNPLILSWINATGTSPTGSYFGTKTNSQCSTWTDCDSNPLNSHYQDLSLSTTITVSAAPNNATTSGFIATTNKDLLQGTGGFWSYFNTGESYSYAPLESNDFNGVSIGPVTAGNNRLIPKRFAIRGFVKIRCMDANSTTCIVPDGADPDPEQWLHVFVLRVKPLMVGKSSEIKVETHAGFTSFTHKKRILSNTALGTFDSQIDGLPADNSVDGGGFADTSVFTVNNGATAIIASGNAEQFNAKIRHRGPTKQATVQSWNVGVCIK